MNILHTRGPSSRNFLPYTMRTNTLANIITARVGDDDATNKIDFAISISFLQTVAGIQQRFVRRNRH